MATSLQVGDLLVARAWAQLDEQGAVNTYGYNVITVSGGAVTDQDFAAAFDGIVSGFYPNLMTPSSEYRGTQVYFVRRSSGGPLPFPVKSIAGAGVGIAADPPTPRNTCGILKYNTIFRGPGGRGRVYLPFAGHAYLAANGRPTNAFDGLVNGLTSVLLIPLVVASGGSSATLVWSLLRRTTGGLPTSTGQIVAAESADKFGQMHKRGDYGRANASPI